MSIEISRGALITQKGKVVKIEKAAQPAAPQHPEAGPGDTLRGAGGAGTFFFASPNDGPDILLDFQHGQDHIMIDVPFNASQVAFVGFEDGVASVPASGR